ncbi:hypothetical protein I316_01816 [Kwoniella heveanensis BCC8398]|uniref:RINT-1 family protein n=1 Tax=Kwoniella heveanensis BCC8398 TaxID=1296120 RepID=A0A1B9GZW7_9TREE|nr:hypothetical protein I316_01816 [Kwoniella heveanensis BCC8398]
MSLPSHSPLIHQIKTVSQPPSSSAQTAQVRAHIDSHFSDLDALLHPHSQSDSLQGQNKSQSQSHAGPSRRRKRGLAEEISYWVDREHKAASELEETSKTLPQQLADTQTRLQTLLSSAQELSLQRYKIADQLAHLVADLSSSSSPGADAADDDPIREQHDQGQGQRKGKEIAARASSETILEQLEGLQAELGRLEAGLAWARVLEQVVVLSERTLDPSSHNPSALSAIPHYRDLHDLVTRLENVLPPQMALMGVVREIKGRTWQGLKDLLSESLLKACEALGWPKKVIYEDVPLESRRTFERAYQDLLYLQTEGDDLHGEERPKHWSAGVGLYPLQAMVKPIELRFKYHFQGTKGTNRVDKPEWAFANILDQIYEHQNFLSSYLQPLTTRAGYEEISIKSEFTLLLLPILLSLLRSRIPHLLDHPALLAHTIYQTVVFDEAVKEGGFELDSTSIYESREGGDWEGLAGVVLREEDWYAQWLEGEKKFANNQLNEIISSPEAWAISDESQENEDGDNQSSGVKPTISARQVKALIEQVTDRYAPLPELTYKLPFLLSIQLPILQTYHTRISGSLDAFETLSSAFVRAVPGALAGNTRSGIHIDQTRLTTGRNGLERLIKAWLSGRWVVEGMRKWSDDLFFVELSADFSAASSIKWKYAHEPLLPASIKGTSAVAGTPASASASVFDILIERYDNLTYRAEDMIVRLVTVEVENELKQHLTRRWDLPPSTEISEPSSHLLSSMTTYTSHLTTLSSLLPPLVVSRLYRKVVDHLLNHILQRGVYAGWSKFTEHGGRDFQNEVSEWKQVSSSALSSSSSSQSEMGLELSGYPVPVGAAWKKLEDIAKVLVLPTGQTQSQPGVGAGVRDGNTNANTNAIPAVTATFAEAMASAWDGENGLNTFKERLGVELSREELQAILRRRVECWR